MNNSVKKGVRRIYQRLHLYVLAYDLHTPYLARLYRHQENTVVVIVGGPVHPLGYH